MRISVILHLLLLVSVAAAQPIRPNVLIIVGDDHSCEGIGAYGSTVARTPNLDRLAAQGFRFDRAYCNVPMCTPSRQSLLTGRYPQCVGVRLLTDVLSDDAYTLAHRLADAGYRTGVFGKTHFNSDKTHGFQTVYTEKDWDAQDRNRTRRPIPPGASVLPPWKPFADPARVWLNGTTLPLPRHDEEMRATIFAEKAIAFMRDQSDRPFYAQIGFNEPHSPYWFPIDFKDRYNPLDMVVPELGPEDRPQIPKIFVDLTHADKQGILASYYTSAAYLDVNVGRVLAALDKLGLSGNTLVIYLGDNGYMLGQHGRFEKHCFYEQAVRVPLIMRLPGEVTAGGSTTAFAEFVDIVPTVLDFAGVPVDQAAAAPKDLHGYSLRPLVRPQNPAADGHRRGVCSEYLHNEEAMFRTADYKLIYRSRRAVTEWYAPVQTPKGREIRLYDLRNDPKEERNLASDPDRKQWVQEGLASLADRYRRFPPAGRAVPVDLSAEDLLDWALDLGMHGR